MTDRRDKRAVAVVLAIVIIIAYIVLVAYSFSSMQRSLFEERAHNVGALMNKINQTVYIGIDNRWNTLENFVSLFSQGSYATMKEAEVKLREMRENTTELMSRLFIIDDTGRCYLSDGTSFEVRDKSVLLHRDNQYYMSGADFQRFGEEVPHMFFIKGMDEDMSIEGKTITHMGLSCEASFMDTYFDITEYGDNSTAFIMDKYGSPVYIQEKNTLVSGSSNLLVSLATANYRYGSSFHDFRESVERMESGCINIEYKGKSYFLAYKESRYKDWVSAIMIPEELVGSSTKEFFTRLVLNTALVIVGGAAVVILFVLYNTSRAKRAREAVNRQLQAAVQAERRANEAKTQFLSAMSHDIRTPMNAIVGMTALASTHIDNKEYVKDCLSKVTLASNHLITLINDVLDISKIEARRMVLNPVVFSLADTAEKLVSIIYQQMKNKEQTLSVRVRDVYNEYLFADELRLNQIFINLLSNAVKYTPEGGKITVDFIEEKIEDKPDKIRLIFKVTDTGIGMSAEFMENMYSSFARSTDAVLSTEGTGLGLAICKQLVDLMGGEILCESRVGEGTAFTVRLEIKAAERAEESYTMPPLRVLLADADCVYLAACADMLGSIGISADLASSAEEALAKLDKAQAEGSEYSLIIWDVNMPNMGGADAAEGINASYGEAPPILISAYDRGGAAEEAVRAGACGVILKPHFRSVLYESIGGLFGIGRGRSAEPVRSEENVAGRNILVAEDNDLNFEIVKEILAIYGASAVRAENGRICVDMIEASEEGEYSLILMDIKMPLMNGYEATRAIRKSQREHVRNIPIVAMTADAFAEDIHACMEAGMNAHLPKPVHIENLIKVIGSL